MWLCQLEESGSMEGHSHARERLVGFGNSFLEFFHCISLIDNNLHRAGVEYMRRV